MKKEGKKPFSLNDLSADYTENWQKNGDKSTKTRMLRDFGRTHRGVGCIEVHFDNIASKIHKIIEQSEVALGAVAWLTNRSLLDALSSQKVTSIVVQKEDFLRNDTSETHPEFRRRLREQYLALNPIDDSHFPESYPGQQDFIEGAHHRIATHLLGYKGLHVAGAVRCLGYSSGQAGEIRPKMHHKFVVFGKFKQDHLIEPKCVVTGSFNWSTNAESSRENIVVIHDGRVCGDFISEWAQLWARSEALDWHSAEPSIQRHFIGT